MYEMSEYGTCNMDKASFRKITSHLRPNHPKDAIELDLMEDSLTVCKW